MENSYKIVLLGLGGQGILFAGKVLAQAAFMDGYQATFIPTYGLEIQNGPVKAEVIISKKEIYNPTITKANNIIVFHKFRIKEVKDLLAEDTKVFSKDFTDNDLKTIKIETENNPEVLKNPKVANMLILGAFAEYYNLLSDKAVSEALKQILIQKPYNVVTSNFKAYQKGKELLKAQV